MQSSQVPGILVAMPTLNDTYFEKSVILLCNYDEDGAFGLVMNHPSTTLVKEILTEELQENFASDTTLLLGGPVEPESFWSVHSPDFSVEETTVLSSKIHLSSANVILASIAAGTEIKSYHLGVGYAGWGAGQLDREIQEESWWLGPLDESLLLDLDYDLRWEATMDNLGFDPLTTAFSQTGMV
ncbi:MAG: YqgE/AlgH family protein [SAR324 cluster bacterium]|nr:YqgE/AlgH family protein [SAR324 cluster bacterium]MBL7035502.1 YqgE/AlgH family protein [SAR324 cluster bacterium]